MLGVLLKSIVKAHGSIQVVYGIDLNVVMVYQNYALYPHLNVADNIASGIRINRDIKTNSEASVQEVSGILELTEYLERRSADVSGGERQRVAMSRAIVRSPKVFLFDKSLSNLDAKLRTWMRAEIKRLQNRFGVTSIYATHDQVEAMIATINSPSPVTKFSRSPSL